MLRLFHRSNFIGKQRRARLRIGQLWHAACALGRHNARHHRRRIGQLGPRDRQLHLPQQRRLDAVILGAHLGGGHHTLLDQQRRAGEQRVARVVRRDMILAEIDQLHIIARMAIKPHRFHMQKHRFAHSPRIVHRFARAAPRTC